MNSRKQTLVEYYKDLPSPKPPKTEFIEKVAKRCGLNEMTVRNWAKGRTKPSDEAHLIILSEETGIPIDELFAQ